LERNEDAVTEGTNAEAVAVGMDVHTRDGESLGTVSSVEGHYVVATAGAIFTSTTYIPVQAVAAVDAAGIVRLGVTGDEVRVSNWNQLPDDFHAGAAVPDVAGRDNLEAAAERIPSGRSGTAAIRDTDPST
jgi:hypothetical protein